MGRAGCGPRNRVAEAPLRFVSHQGPIELASAVSLAAPMIEEGPCIVHAAGGLLAEPLAPLAKCLNDGMDAMVTVQQASSKVERLSPAARSVSHLAELDPSRPAFGVAGVWAFRPDGIQRAAVNELIGRAPGAATGTTHGIDLTVMAERITSVGGRIHVRPGLSWPWRSARTCTRKLGRE